jgi:hypothetical protein
VGEQVEVPEASDDRKMIVSPVVLLLKSRKALAEMVNGILVVGLWVLPMVVPNVDVPSEVKLAVSTLLTLATQFLVLSIAIEDAADKRSAEVLILNPPEDAWLSE